MPPIPNLKKSDFYPDPRKALRQLLAGQNMAALLSNPNICKILPPVGMSDYGKRAYQQGMESLSKLAIAQADDLLEKLYPADSKVTGSK